MGNDIKEILISEAEIKQAVERLAEQLNRDYRGKELLLILILKGSVVFCADLMRRLQIPVTLDCMRVSSYGGGTVSSGEIDIKLDLSESIGRKHVLLVEDIIDTGNTLAHLKKLLDQRGPASLKICTLLDKPDRRTNQLEADYTGIKIPDKFVVGYGLDYKERFRELPYIGVLGEWVYE